MKTKIKTIWYRANNRCEFDKEVNDCLQNGWNLGRIEVVPARTFDKYTMFFALLFKQE